MKLVTLGLATVMLFTACNLNRTPTTASNSPAPAATPAPVPTATPAAETSPAPDTEPVDVVETANMNAYRAGFEDGFRAAKENRTSGSVTTTGSGSSGKSKQAQRVYYDYQPEKKESFWSKHRDILTLAAGTGGGAILGGVVGGKKGAGIGALAGAGGSALYTYKLRKRN